jgi:hypothetical protein
MVELSLSDIAIVIKILELAYPAPSKLVFSDNKRSA